MGSVGRQVHQDLQDHQDHHYQAPLLSNSVVMSLPYTVKVSEFSQCQQDTKTLKHCSHIKKQQLDLWHNRRLAIVNCKTLSFCIRPELEAQTLGHLLQFIRPMLCHSHTAVSHLLVPSRSLYNHCVRQQTRPRPGGFQRLENGFWKAAQVEAVGPKRAAAGFEYSKQDKYISRF